MQRARVRTSNRFDVFSEGIRALGWDGGRKVGGKRVSSARLGGFEEPGLCLSEVYLRNGLPKIWVLRDRNGIYARSSHPLDRDRRYLLESNSVLTAYGLFQ